MTQHISCYNCRFFSPGEFGCPSEMHQEMLGEYEEDNKGECRRHPLHYRYGMTITLPNRDEYIDAASWPKVAASDWCGEFKPRHTDGNTKMCDCANCAKGNENRE